MKFGTYPDSIANTDLLEVDIVPGRHIPRLAKHMRLKEWQAFQFANETHFVHVALFNAKIMALVQVKVYDKISQTKYVFEKQVAPWKVQAPRQIRNSNMQFAEPGTLLAFENRWDHGYFTIRISTPAGKLAPEMRGEIRLERDGCEPMVGCMPFGENRGTYSQKAHFRASGTLAVGEKLVEFDRENSFGLMDDQKGYFPYVMQWDWATFAGVDSAGRRIGVNLTRNQCIDPDGYNENVLWIDGRRHLFGAVTFTRVDGPPEIWTIRDAHGRVDVTFDLEIDGRVIVNALVVESRYRGPLGWFSGILRTETGEVVEFSRLFGMAEKFHLRA